MEKYRIKDISLAEQGKGKIYWAESRMPVLMKIRERFEKEKPLAGETIVVSIHMTKETAVMIKTLRAGGAKVILTASNRFSAQDDVVAALAADGFNVYGWKGETIEDYWANMNAALDYKPTILVDDGVDMTYLLHTSRTELIPNIKGGSEETTGGVNRLNAMQVEGVLKFPMIAVNNAQTKNMFDNRYGCGQSILDGIMRATNLLIAGKIAVVTGYGWCGRGLAIKCKGMGADVIVTEVDAVKALEAAMDGFRVMPMTEAAKLGDIFITATGGKNIITKKDIELLKDGAVLSNAGHFDKEICFQDVEAAAKSKKEIRAFTMEYTLKNGNRIYLLGGGGLINLIAAEGHPSEVMDMSFANQVLAAEFVKKNYKKLKPIIHPVPDGQDAMIAGLKLETMGIKIDKLTDEQRQYFADWRETAG